MLNDDKARMKVIKVGTEQVGRKTEKLPDMVVPTPFGPAVITHVPQIRTGIMVRDDGDESVIGIMLTSVDEARPRGMIFMANPDEARSIGEGLINMADESYRAKMHERAAAAKEEEEG